MISNAIAAIDMLASTFPELKTRSTADPINRPTVAPAQYRPISFPASYPGKATI